MQLYANLDGRGFIVSGYPVNASNNNHMQLWFRNGIIRLEAGDYTAVNIPGYTNAYGIDTGLMLRTSAYTDFLKYYNNAWGFFVSTYYHEIQSPYLPIVALSTFIVGTDKELYIQTPNIGTFTQLTKTWYNAMGATTEIYYIPIQ